MWRMNRFFSGLAALPFVLIGASAQAQDAQIVSLAALSAYFNALETAQATFTQINFDGTVSTGDLYLHRPGRMRFDYDGEDLLVIAGGQRVAIFDGRSNTRPEQYPLAETPLSLVLAQQVDFTRSGLVADHSFDGTATRVLAQDPDRPEIGTLELVFTGDPVELRQWVVTDSGGVETTVVLGGLETGVPLRPALFSINTEINTRRDD